MRKKRSFKLAEGSTTSNKFTCQCGFELVFHTDMDFVLPKKCPVCHKFTFTSNQQSKEVVNEEDGIEMLIATKK